MPVRLKHTARLRARNRSSLRPHGIDWRGMFTRLPESARGTSINRLTVRDDYVFSGGFSDGRGYEAMRRLLRLRPRPYGMFCCNDPVAAGAITAVLEPGLHVPDDITIIGAGDVHYSGLLRVPLSSVSQNSLKIGQVASEPLLERIAARTQGAPRRIFFPPRLVVRNSTSRSG